MDKISIIIPCYNEEKVLSRFYRETSKEVSKIRDAECEFIFVDDGSRDHTPDLLQSFTYMDHRCKFISFSRNLGKEAAMYAGLKNASGNYCVFMDADLQHPPALLKEMYRAVKTEGYDCCAGLREDRTGEGHVRNLLSHAFYRILGRICNLDMADGAGDFRMMNRAMANAVLELREYNRYMKGIFSFVGFSTKWIPFRNTERAAGESKWSFRSLFRYALDGILSFSSAPASLSGAAGALLLIASLVTFLGFLFSGYFLPESDRNIVLLLVSLILMLHGVQMLFLAILGQYIFLDYMESKHRPIYIEKQRGGF